MTSGTAHQLLVADSTYRGLAERPTDMVTVGEMEIRGRESGIELWGLVEEDAPLGAQTPPSSEAATYSP
jgi:hypothetical protein